MLRPCILQLSDLFFEVSQHSRMIEEDLSDGDLAITDVLIGSASASFPVQSSESCRGEGDEKYQYESAAKSGYPSVQ